MVRGDRHAGYQSSAAYRNHEDIEGRLSGQHFQRNGALSRNDAFIVVGMDERQPPRNGKRRGMLMRVVERVAVEHDVRPERARVGPHQCPFRRLRSCSTSARAPVTSAAVP